MPVRILDFLMDGMQWQSAVIIIILQDVQEPACLDESPVLQEQQFTLLHWAAGYYQHPIGEVFTTALPAKLRKGESNARPSLTYWKVTETDSSEPSDIDISSFPICIRQQYASETM